MDEEFKIKFDDDYKNLDPCQYNFIPSVRYSDQIALCCNKLKESTGIEYFSLCIEYANRKFYLSNNPGNIAIPYYTKNLHKIDCSFTNLNKSTNSVFYPDENKDPFSSLFIDLLKNQFNIYNHYGITCSHDGYNLTIVLSGHTPVNDKKLLFKTTHNNIKTFTIDFFDNFKWIFQENASWLKCSKLFNEENFIGNLINNHNNNEHDNLSYGEILCLYWYKEGKTTKEIAKITKYSPLTISSYFKAIKEKLAVRSTQQAMLIAIQKGLIS